MATKKLGAVTTAAKKKLEEEAKKAAEEAKRRAQAAATAQKAKQQTQQKASTVAKKAAQTVKAKAAQATAEKTKTAAKKATSGTAGKIPSSAAKNKTASTDGHGRSTSVKYVSTRRTSSTLKSATEQVNRALKDAQKTQRRTNESAYQASGSKFATDWTARQAARTTAFQYSRGEQRKDMERLSSPSKDRPNDVSRFYLRSGTVAPMDLLRADTISGRNPARTMPAQSESQKARAAARKKQAEINQKRYARIPISAEDKKLSAQDQMTIQQARSAWAKARDAGDLPGMRRAHEIAETVRYRHGYTGGETGDTPYKPTLSVGERISMNKEGETALRQAMLDADRAIGPTAKKLAAARIEDVKNSERNKSALQKQRDREEKREEDRRRILSDPSSTQLDAHGRPMPGDGGDAWRSYSRIEAAGYGIAGGLAKAAESVVNAARNNERERMRDEWRRMADRIPDYEGQLRAYDELKAQGYSPSTNRDVLVKQLAAARHAQNQLEQMSLDPRSDWFDPTQAGLRGLPATADESLGDRWIRTSEEARQRALQDLGSVGQFLTNTTISGYQMVPSVAAAMIPGAGPAIGAAIMGGQAMGQKAYDLEQAGGTASGEVLLRGLGSGLIEAATEAIPLHRLARVARGGTGKTILSNMMTQAGIEGAEEAASYLGNYAADWAARDPNREMSMAGLAEQALSGAILGGVFGGAAGIAGMPARGGSNVPTQTASVQTAPIAPPTPAATTESARTEQRDTARQRLEQTLEQRRAAQTQTTAAETTDLPEAVRQQMNRVRERMAERAAQQTAQQAAVRRAAAPTTRRQMPRSDAPRNQREILERNISSLGENGKRAILSQYQDGEDVLAYRRGFQAVYDQALNGKDDDAISIPRSLSTLQARAAADAGRNDRAAQIEREQAAAENARVAKNGGLMDRRAVREIVGRKQADEIHQVAKAFGQRVRVVSAAEMTNANAQGEVTGTEIKINRDYRNGDPVAFIVGHEFTHRMQEISPEAYRSYRDVLMQDEAILARVDDVLRAYEQAGERLTRDQAMDEIAADEAGQLFSNTTLMQDFITRNRANQNVLVRMWQAIKSMAAKLTGRQKQQADEAMSLLEAAMDETARRVKDLPTGKRAAVAETQTPETGNVTDTGPEISSQVTEEAPQPEKPAAEKPAAEVKAKGERQEQQRRDDPERARLEKAVVDARKTRNQLMEKAGVYAFIEKSDAMVESGQRTINEHYAAVAQFTKNSPYAKRIAAAKRAVKKASDALRAHENGGTSTRMRGTRYSFAGGNARTANVQRLSKAQEMEENGQDNESIRQETGWHKGRDGKWRFEIDDSQMQYFPDGDARFRQAHPEYVEYQELYQKLYDGTLTDAERPRLEKLEDLWGNELGRISGRVMRDEATLEDILQHDALFEAYPELRNVRVEMRDMAAELSGRYDRNRNTITLNSRDVRQTQESALIHEIQHAIQQIEGFANGTSPAAYERTRKELEDAARGAEHNRDLWLKDAGLPDFVRESMEQVRQGKRTIQEHFAALERFKQESKYAEEIAASEEDVRRAREKMAEYGTPYDRYKRTAGEIEARDTQARRKLTAEERKKTAPDLGGEDTVFAEGSGPSSLIDPDFAEDVKTWDKEGRPDGETFVLGSTGSVLQGLGAIESDIYIQGDKIKNILAEHREMTVREVQQIPGILEDPVLILKSQNKGRGGKQNTRMVLYGSVRAQNGEPVLTVLDLRPVENGLVVEDMQKVSSAYTKTTNPTDFVRNSEVIHADKKRAVPLLRTIGFQMPIELQRNGSVGSISYKGQNVNISGLPFSDVVQETAMSNNTRSSIKSPGVTGADAAALVRENRELRKKLEHWKAQVKRTDRRDVDPKSLRQLARRLRGDYSTEMGADEIATRLGEIYNGITHDMAYEEARERAQALATDMIEQASVTEDYLYHEYEPMREYFRETPLVLTPTDQKEITDYNDFRKSMMGKLRLQTGERSNVDQVYQELSMLWPEFFDEQREITSLDQVERIAQVLDDIYRRDEVNPYAGDMAGPANFLASEIMESFWDAPAVKKTFADRAEEKLAKATAGKARMAQRWHEAVRAREETEMNARWREAELKATYEWLSAKDRHERKQKYDAAIKAVREQRDRKIRAEQEKRWEAVAAIREQRDRKLSEQAAYHRETVQGMRQRQKERELRARIIRHSRDLSKKLLRPSDNQHVPQELRGAAAAVLESINLESVYTYDPVTGRRSKNPNGTPAKRTQAFQELRIAYQQIAEAEGLDTLALDPDLMTNITAVESFRDTPISALSLDQLDTVWRTVKAMEASITTANKMLAQSRFASVKDASVALKTDNEHKNQRAQFREAPGRFQKLLGTDMLTPQQYFHRMGKAGDEIFRMLRSAQDKQISLLREITENVHDATKGVNTRKLGKEKKTFTFGEESVTFTKAQIMSLYALMKRPQAVAHILVGGMRPGQYRSGIKESERVAPIRLEQAQIESITNSLTKEEKGVADRLQKILEKRMAAAGNEASMTVYGYEKFGDEHYFPIRTDKNQTVDDQAKGAQAATLPGRGFAQQTKPNASNAVIIDDIFDVVSDHVAEMSTYAAFLPAMEDLKRIFNFRFREEEGGGNVKAIIETVHGKHGTNYWRKLTEDLNNGIQGINDSPFGGLVGSYKASAIGANLRVMIQQPTSILRAMDEVNPADLIAAAGSVTPGAWERAKRYSPIAEWKSWGYFDAYTGRTVRDILFEDGDGLNRANNFLMSGAGAMDSLAWTHLWRALEIETKRRRKDLTPKTEEFYQAVAERFNRVIDRTQVVDGILQRSQIMRSPDGLTKMATSFMAEPTKIYNMLTGAAYDARNAATAAERKQAGGRLARTALALTTSVSVNAAMQSVVDALRDDDNDETYLEKFLQAFLGVGEDAKDEREARKNYIFSNLAEGFNPVNFVPFVRDLWSLVQGYSVDRMDMEAIGRLVSEGQNMMKALEGGGKITTANATMRMIGELGRLVGVPAANIKRDSLAIVQTILRGTGSYKPLFEVAKFLYRVDNPNNANTFLDIIYAARRAGDMTAYGNLSKELTETLGKDEKWLEGKMTTRLAEDGDLAGIEAEQFRMFSQQVGNIKGDENGTKQENIISYIDGLDLSDEQKSALFRTQYDSDKNNPWA